MSLILFNLKESSTGMGEIYFYSSYSFKFIYSSSTLLLPFSERFIISSSFIYSYTDFYFRF